MGADLPSELPPSGRGVALHSLALVVALLLGAFFAYFGWRLLGTDFPFGLRVLMPVGALVLTVGAASTSIQGIRLQRRPSLPRARDGALEMRVPDAMCRSFLLLGIGGTIFAIGGALMIWRILTSEPMTLIRAIGVLGLLLMLAYFVFLFAGALRSRRMLFVADASGLRFDSPIGLLSVRLPWQEVASLRLRGGSIFGIRIVAMTKAGRVHLIPIPAPSMPMSRDARLALMSEIEVLRPVPDSRRRRKHGPSEARPEREADRITSPKEPSIIALLERLDLEDRGWQTLPDWDAYRYVVGIARTDEPSRLVYISTFERGRGRYDYECEVDAGPGDEDYLVTGSGEDVDFETLVDALKSHLSVSRSMPDDIR